MASTLTAKEMRKLKALADSLPKMQQKLQQTKSKNQRRSRRGRSRRVAALENRIERISTDVDRYIRSIHTDVLDLNTFLPTVNYNGPYAKHIIQGRTTLNLANTANLHGGVTVNPYLAFMDLFAFEKELAGVDIQTTVPTVGQHSIASTSGGLPFGSNFQSVAMNGRITNTFGSPRSGWVRCLGVHFKIIYTGTWNNRGGTIVCFTNPSNIALLDTSQAATAAAPTGTGFDGVAEIDQSLEMCQIFPLQDEFSWTWRPETLDFVQFDGAVAFEDANVAAGNSYNQLVRDYLPDETHGLKTASKGWVTGFEFRPAAGTQATASNYVVDISIEYDICEHTAVEASNAVSTLPHTHRAHQDPIQAARVHNALNACHHARRSLKFPPSAKSLALNALKGVEDVGKNAMVEAIGSRLGSMLA